MIRAARSDEGPEIERFLARYPLTSMFLRSNLETQGLNEKEHPHGTTFYVQDEGAIKGVCGLTNAGGLLMQMPEAGPENWQEVRACLAGQTIGGLSGAEGQMDCALRAFGLVDSQFQFLQSEPLYELALKTIQSDAILRAPKDADRPLLTEWYKAYHLETGLSEPGPELDKIVAERAQNATTSGKVRLLIEAGQVTAVTGINARIGEIVQIGGVYTPPPLRNAGRAGQAMLKHMQELQNDGVKTAILFAASAKAAGAYERIGFQYRCQYKLAFLRAPKTIEASL